MRRVFTRAFRGWRQWAFPLLFMQFQARKILCLDRGENIEEEIKATMSKIFFSPEQCEHTDLKIFAFGGGVLGSEVVSHLDISLGKHETLRYSDGEIDMRLLDSVSGHKVFIIKTFENQKINEGLMELMLAVSCMKKAGAAAVVAIVPYFPYSRVDRLSQTDGMVISNTFFAADVAKMIESCGCDMIITMNGQIHEMKGFTDKCTFMNVDCSELVVPYLIHKEISHPVIVGSSLNPFHSTQVKNLAETFNYFDLQCDMGFYYSDQVYVGTEIKDREIILFDNIIGTGARLRSRIHNLRSRGAKSIYCFAAHGLSSGDELNRIANEEGIKELILTNSVQQASDMQRVRYISVGKLLAEMICLIHKDMSLNSFRNERSILKMAFVEKIRRFAATHPEAI